MNKREFPQRMILGSVCAVLALSVLAWPGRAGKREERPAPVTTVRVPGGGIQPQIAVDAKGVLHMIYFAGEAAHGDLYYVRSTDHGATFSAPIKVNSHPGSSIATGNIRGAHMALGRNGRADHHAIQAQVPRQRFGGEAGDALAHQRTPRDRGRDRRQDGVS